MEKTEGKKCWTAQNETFLLCRIFLPHFRFSNGCKMSILGKFERLKRRSSSLSNSSSPWSWRHPFKTYIEVLHVFKSGINVCQLKFKAFPLWDTPENSFHYSTDKTGIFHGVKYTDKKWGLRWRGALWNSVKKHLGYLNQMLLNLPQELLA